MLDTPRERQSRYKQNMKALGYHRVERWEKDDGTDSREFNDIGKLLLNSLLQSLLSAVEKGILTYSEYEKARNLWQPILGKDA